MGDLSDQWHTRQMALLNQHVTLINIYNMALDTLDVAAHSGNWRKGGVWVCRGGGRAKRCKWFERLRV